MRRAMFLSTPELWQHGHGPQHPLKPERLKRTVALLEAYNAFDAPNAQVVEPRPATEDELALFHTRDYIRAVQALSAGHHNVPAWQYNFGPGDNPVFKDMYESERLKAGSALLGAEALLDERCDVAFSFGGGLHHAMPNSASGFCVFNDPAIAIHWLLQQGKRVAYVDIDAHHGDGVQDAFYDTDQVLTISLHQDGRTLFPGTGFVDEYGVGPGKGYSVNVPLPPYTNDEAYLWVFQQVVLPLLKRFDADVLVTQLGTDAHYQDPLAHLALTTDTYTSLFEIFDSLASRWLALGGGGYNLSVVPRVWTLAFGVMSGQTFPDAMPAAYREQYGGQYLHDHEEPDLDATTRERVRNHLEKVATAIQERHHLT